MEQSALEPSQESRPLTFTVAKWYSYIFSMFFLLYGGVNIILGILDRDYSELGTWLIFLIIGIILTTICVGFRDGRSWGWYGLIAVNGLVVAASAIGYSEPLNLVFLALSLGCLGLLLAPATKAEIT